MKSNYRPIGNYIRRIDERNADLTVDNLQGIRINKELMPSVANVIGTDLSKYKVVHKYQFAYNPMHVGRDKVLPISLLLNDEPVIVSPAYVVFEIIDHAQLLPEYLMMWCRRSEFDRNAWFMTDSSVRGGFSWDDFCDMRLPVPDLAAQTAIVNEYAAVVNRILLNQQLNRKLEETAQAIYKQWFVEFDFPDEQGKPYKSSGGAMEYNVELDQEIPKGWEVKAIKEICDVINGRAYKETEFVEKGTPIIRIQNLNGGTKYVYSDLQLDKDKYVECDDLIFAWSATFGPFIWRGEKSIYHYHIWKLNCFKKDYKFFLYNYLQRVTKKVSSQGSGSIFAHITKSLMESQTLIIPDAITLRLFDNYASKIDLNISATLKEIELCTQLCDVLLPEMSTF